MDTLNSILIAAGVGLDVLEKAADLIQQWHAGQDPTPEQIDALKARQAAAEAQFDKNLESPSS